MRLHVQRKQRAGGRTKGSHSGAERIARVVQKAVPAPVTTVPTPRRQYETAEIGHFCPKIRSLLTLLSHQKSRALSHPGLNSLWQLRNRQFQLKVLTFCTPHPYPLAELMACVRPVLTYLNSYFWFSPWLPTPYVAAQSRLKAAGLLRA